jgi:hypothetical protein
MKAALPILMLLAAGAAHAADAPPTETAAPAAPPTSVSEVDVSVPRDAPSVSSTWPKQGATVAPGVLVLSVAFDQRMTDSKGSYSKGEAGEMPECLDEPLLRSDAKTFLLLCKTKPNTRYEIALNAPPSVGFSNVGRRAAAPYTLSFQTSTAEPVFSLPRAMRAAGLPETESPIRTAPRANVPVSPPN